MQKIDRLLYKASALTSRERVEIGVVLVYRHGGRWMVDATAMKSKRIGDSERVCLPFDTLEEAQTAANNLDGYTFPSGAVAHFTANSSIIIDNLEDD